MDIFECIEKRRSTRTYDRKDVPNELIVQIITAGTYAPSVGNIQPWEFIIVRDRKIKKELSVAALRQKHVENAPTLIVVLANKEKSGMRYKDRGRNLYCIQDTAACIENMLLACTALGLGACWTGAFEEDKVKTILKTPENLRPVAILTIGFPVPYEKQFKPSRISFEEITWEDQYGKEPKWIMKLGTKSRFEWKPLDQQIEKLKERTETLKTEKKELEKKEKPKLEEKEGLAKRFIRFVKNLSK